MSSESESDSFRAMAGRIREFRDARAWAQFHTPKELAVAIAANWWAVLIATVLLVAVITADIALGASPAKVGARRSGDTSVRLGEEGTNACRMPCWRSFALS